MNDWPDQKGPQRDQSDPTETHVHGLPMARKPVLEV